MINEEDVINEIIHSVGERDIIKTKVLLRETPQLTPNSTKRLMYEISSREGVYSIPLLVYILTQVPDLARSFGDVQEVLVDKVSTLEDLQETFNKMQTVEEIRCYIEAVGERTDELTVPFLTGILRNFTDRQVILSTLKAMADIKNPAFAQQAADFLYAEDLDIVKQTVRTLGRCCTPLAVQALKGRTGSDKSLDNRIIEALASCGLECAYESLVALLASGQVHLRNKARVELFKLKEKAVPGLAKALKVTKNDDFRIICLNTLGETRAPEAVKPIRHFIQSCPENENVRFAAYESLGLLPVKAGAYTLTDGLSDVDETVRTAAAKAVDHLWEDFMQTGVENLLIHADKPETIVDAFLTAECDRAFTALLKNSNFKEMCLEHFQKNMDSELIAHFLKVSQKAGDSDMLEILMNLKGKDHDDSSLEVCVVDDSRLLLKIYRKMLAPTGLSFHLFEFAQAALEYIKENKPALLITDLNMPQMNGFELSKEVRKVYSKEDLPIVMVTTQQEGDCRENSSEAGIQEYLLKPFNDQMLNKVLDKYLA